VLRVAIVDDHPVVRHGIASILAGVDDIVVGAAVSSPDELPRTASGDLETDVILFDLYQPDGRPAFAAIRELSTQCPVLIISVSGDPAEVVAAMQAGASGYLTKHASEEAYASAIRSVAAGTFYFSAHLADLIQAATVECPTPYPQKALSQREQQTLEYIARGLTHQQAATRMGVSKTTVDTYIARIRTKLHLGNKAELALAALRYLRKASD
jgi:DNA-binding NarL/FixJ family response regulator